MSEKRSLCLALLVVAILISLPVVTGSAPLNIVRSRLTRRYRVTVPTIPSARALDVLHYSTTLEPDIAGKSVKGTVRIRFSTESQQAEFNCGDLAIDSVRFAGATVKFSVMDHRLRVSLPLDQQARPAHEIEIHFHGTPKRGIRFFSGSTTGLHGFFHQPVDGLRGRSNR